jgi:chemotaxis response regulator CheB
MTRVYLIFQTTMFRDAVTAIFAAHPAIQLAGMHAESGPISAELAALRPDVVLVEESVAGALVADTQSLLTSDIPCRLITLRLDANGMHVWSQTWHHAVETDDLVQAIVTAKHGPGTPNDPTPNDPTPNDPTPNDREEEAP